MTKSLIQLLAIPALLAGLVQSHPTDVKRDQYPPCPLRIDIADGDYLNIGDNFEIKWDPTGLPEAPVNLIIQSQLVTPWVSGHYYNPFTHREEDILEFDAASIRIPDPPLSSRGYTWPVEIIGRSNHTGPEYRYAAYISYTVLIVEGAGDVSESCSTPEFHVTTPA
ncbi:hypothetical protein NPX13_g3353 [Xylaria arbuscula]|uniref:Uncharacterized protein n=1 Tax=Xylaria arbuscula TaxID=114810 RepID=A0A9W8NIM1_9PEZI|nr:hypothetical protein NPX13_g3353 [Xylaria arbuscula]